MSATRVDEAVERLVVRVVAGEFADRPLPREQDLADELEVSRLTLREAVKVLKTQGVLRVEQGRGTFVNPVRDWESVDLVARASRDERRTHEQLIEVRRFMETGATALFAQCATPELLARMGERLEAMRRADATGDVDGFVEADLAFHDVILENCGNPFVAMLYRPISDLLRANRYVTGSRAHVRSRAIEKHAAILAALREGTAAQAERAMLDHIEQTREDL
ncbi:DNA-binding FadR family transcriptional regulator [Kineosphaera limosa]|uniref:Putative GntR family transcriptional regulator n=1 Tax=Kineosphaera limosa NBRC 100340 TaxID=1184609 RepID=K6W7C7_9MICO|nr:FadR/GntR family transcriptional regulator [Kineosphaera limosa]NYE03012.1 DNA-binding FadR family transcriptional regulator [Kineosphaera limosa]GAB95095.1 putative GntR family transcriptional regulator [Kineosphaera limosa NBRC 100340]